jgi:hypothetical protein
MHLAVLLARRVAQVYGRASQRTLTPLPSGMIGTTRRFAPHLRGKPMIPVNPTSKKMARIGLELDRLG